MRKIVCLGLLTVLCVVAFAVPTPTARNLVWRIENLERYVSIDPAVIAWVPLTPVMVDSIWGMLPDSTAFLARANTFIARNTFSLAATFSDTVHDVYHVTNTKDSVGGVFIGVGAVTLKSTLGVTGVGSFTDTVHDKYHVTNTKDSVGGTFIANGAATFKSTIGVTSFANFSDTVHDVYHVTNTKDSVGGTFISNGAATFKSTIAVTGKGTFSDSIHTVYAVTNTKDSTGGVSIANGGITVGSGGTPLLKVVKNAASDSLWLIVAGDTFFCQPLH